MTALRTAIVQAFPVDAPPKEILEAPEPYMEEYFSGRRSDDCSPRDLRAFGESLGFFSTEAWCYYMPAFMLAHLDDPKASDHIGQAICIHLLNTEPHELAVKLSRLTQAQRQVIAEFVYEIGPVVLGDPREVRAIIGKMENAL